MLDDYPIDDDYIGVEEKQADTSRSDETRYDGAHTFDRSDDGTAGTPRDVEIDLQTVSDRDKRGGTVTGFNPSEASEGILSKSVTREGQKQKFAQWLRSLQDGYRDKNRKEENMREEERKFIETTTSLLEMTPYQRERVTHIIENMNFRYLGPYPMETAVLSTISIVSNEDDRWIREEDAFQQLVCDIDSSMGDIKNVRNLVKENSTVL